MQDFLTTILESQEEYRQYFKDAPDKHYKHLMAMLPNFLNPIPIDVQLIHPHAKPITKGDPEDVDNVEINGKHFLFNLGYDVFVVPDEIWRPATHTEKSYYDLMPFESKLFHTGIKVATPPNWGFFLKEKSGVSGNNDISVRAGVIEGTYRGEWQVKLMNLGSKPYRISDGNKIVQAVLIPIFPGDVNVVKELPESKRGVRGWGSSGR